MWLWLCSVLGRSHLALVFNWNCWHILPFSLFSTDCGQMNGTLAHYFFLSIWCKISLLLKNWQCVIRDQIWNKYCHIVLSTLPLAICYMTSVKTEYACNTKNGPLFYLKKYHTISNDVTLSVTPKYSTLFMQNRLRQKTGPPATRRTAAILVLLTTYQ